MRRMYSEQELTNVIKEVFDQEIESGAFDEKVSDAVDAYLEEHPVDITALEGKDVEVKSIEATDSIKYLEKIVDSDGHKRFLQGDVSLSLTGVTKTFGKWTLSGTHLMIVVAGSIEGETTTASSSVWGTFGLPECPAWLQDKIYPLKSSVVAFAKATVILNDWTKTDFDVQLEKFTNYLSIIQIGSKTFSSASVFRIVFDLVIN